jgi:hypothetical protein
MFVGLPLRSAAGEERPASEKSKRSYASGKATNQSLENEQRVKRAYQYRDLNRRRTYRISNKIPMALLIFVPGLNHGRQTILNWIRSAYGELIGAGIGLANRSGGTGGGGGGRIASIRGQAS